MKTRLSILLAVVMILSCEEPATESFADCSKGLITGLSRDVNFPLSELKMKVPKDWLSLSLEDERVETTYLADSALFVRTKSTLALSLSSSKTKFKTLDLEAPGKDFFKSKASQIVDEGRTRCYGKECLYQISRDSSMIYGSFLFFEGDRLHIINLTTSSDTGERDRFCALMSLLTNVSM